MLTKTGNYVITDQIPQTISSNNKIQSNSSFDYKKIECQHDKKIDGI